MSRISKKHVIVAFPPTLISRVDKMSGIFRFVSKRNNWRIDMRQTELDAKALENADGVLITGDVPMGTRKTLNQANIPTAFIAIESTRRTNVISIETNPVDIGKRIANYFLSRGIYEELAVIQKSNPSSFYKDCVATVNRCCKAARVPCRNFTERLLAPGSLRKPLAVFAVNDYLAARAIADCQACGLAVPRDVAVMGFVNDVVFCENNSPTISSAEPDFEQQGYLAAQELDRIMSARKICPRRTLAVGLKQIVERASTTLPHSGNGLVRNGLAFIRKNAKQPICVADVIAHLKVSRRLGELRFREITGRTILESIHDARLEATKKALLASDDSIADVCEHCGWKSENGPKKIFRSVYGMSMREYRVRNAKGSPTDPH